MKIEQKIKWLERLGKWSTINFVKMALEQGDRQKAHRIADANLPK